MDSDHACSVVPPRLPDATQIVVQLFGPHAKRPGIVGGEEPVLQKVPHEELVARDVPEEERLPLLEIAVVLRQNDERAVSSVRIEASVQDLGHVAKPGGAAGADEVLISEAIKILALRTSEVPRGKDRVGLVDQRALDDGERRGDVRARGHLHASPLLAYGTARAAGFGPGEPEGQQRHVVVRSRENAWERHGAAFSGSAEFHEPLDVAVVDDFERTQSLHQVGILQTLEPLKERSPVGRVVEPVFPPRVELLFDDFGEPPQRHAPGRIEDLGAAVRRHREHRSGLGEMVRPRESPAQGCRAETTELALRVPPPGKVHLTEPRDDEAQFQKAVEINRRGTHRLASFAVRRARICAASSAPSRRPRTP